MPPVFQETTHEDAGIVAEAVDLQLLDQDGVIDEVEGGGQVSGDGGDNLILFNHLGSYAVKVGFGGDS